MNLIIAYNTPDYMRPIVKLLCMLDEQGGSTI